MAREASPSVDEQIALIHKHQQQVAERVSSPLRSYLLLGVLWAMPIAAVHFGIAWSMFAFGAVVVCSLLWGCRITQKTGVKLAQVSQDSPAATWGAFLLAGWCLCATLAGFGVIFEAPVVAWIAAGLSVVSTTVTSWKIDRLMFGDASKRSVVK